MKITLAIHALQKVEQHEDNVTISINRGDKHIEVTLHDGSRSVRKPISISLHEINEMIDALTFMKDAIQGEQGDAPSARNLRSPVGLGPVARSFLNIDED